MKKILVTGGAGFIGSHLCNRLIKEDNKVICMDNLFTGSIENIEHLLHNKDFTFINQDVSIPLNIQVDEIYNLACPASPVHYQFNSVMTLRTSILGAINMLELAEKNGCKILQASTSEVYGDPHIHPQPESYWGNVNPVGIRSCYDEGKRAAETFFIDYHRQNKTRIKIIRIFNTYGPRMQENDGRVVSNFIMQALKNKDITIYGDGSQTRSFMFVDDLIEGMIRTMATGDSFTGPVNLGNPSETSIRELAEKIIDFTQSKSKIVLFPIPEDDPKKRKPDISLARQMLDNWSPEISLNKGLLSTIRYFDNIMTDVPVTINAYV